MSDIFAIGIGTDSTLAVYKQRFSPNFNIQPVSDSLMMKFTSQLPRLYFIRRDSIVKIESREINSPWSDELE